MRDIQGIVAQNRAIRAKRSALKVIDELRACIEADEHAITHENADSLLSILRSAASRLPEDSPRAQSARALADIVVGSDLVRPVSAEAVGPTTATAA